MTQAKHIPICPKCGYDQRGEIATWESVCPLDGRCPECGFEFEWADLLDPSRVDLGWYVEHAKSKWGIVRRTPGTLGRLLIPNLYWRAVGVHTRIQHRAIVTWMVFLWLCSHAIAVIPVGFGNWEEGGKWFGITSLEGYYQAYGIIGGVYELHNAIAAPFLRIDYDRSFFHYEFGGYFHQNMTGTLAAISFPIALSTTWLVIVLALPTTRKIAKLRKSHALRAWLISLTGVVIFYESFRIVSGLIGGSNGRGMANWMPYVFLAVLVFTIVWIQWFWIAGMRIGWGIRPCWHISILGVIASFLAGAIVITLMFGY